MQGRTRDWDKKIGNNLLCCSCLGKMVFWEGFFSSRLFCCAGIRIAYSGLSFPKGHQSWLPRSREIPLKRGSHNSDGICDIYYVRGLLQNLLIFWPLKPDFGPVKTRISGGISLRSEILDHRSRILCKWTTNPNPKSQILKMNPKFQSQFRKSQEFRIST